VQICVSARLPLGSIDSLTSFISPIIVQVQTHLYIGGALVRVPTQGAVLVRAGNDALRSNCNHTEYCSRGFDLSGRVVKYKHLFIVPCLVIPSLYAVIPEYAAL
jgi:hypothetical protein